MQCCILSAHIGHAKAICTSSSFLSKVTTNKKKRRIANCDTTLFIYEVNNPLHLDLNLNTAWQLKLHQCINSLSCRTVDVNKTLVV